MCFRPPDASGGAVCPACGKKVNSTNGVLPTKCPFCKTQFDESGDPPAVKAPSAPTAPAAPGIPGAPKASGAPPSPTQPGTPRVPGMPG